jgi:hypothetical protein
MGNPSRAYILTKHLYDEGRKHPGTLQNYSSLGLTTREVTNNLERIMQEEEPYEPPKYSPQSLGIPKPFYGARLEHFEPGELRSTGPEHIDPSAFARWIQSDDFQRSLYLYGLNGRGKSYLAAAVAMTWGCHWRSWPQIATDLTSTFGRQSERSQAGIIRHLTTAPGLVIDDAFRGGNKDWVLDALLLVLENAWEAGKPIIVTSHLKLSEVHHIDSHLASRLLSFAQVLMLGEDRRGRAR